MKYKFHTLAEILEIHATTPDSKANYIFLGHDLSLLEQIDSAQLGQKSKIIAGKYRVY